MDLDGKRIVITGANSGVGFETSKALAARGAHVIMACRSRERGQRALERIQDEVPTARLELAIVDLASQQDIRRFAQATAKPVDVLINNAGVYSRKRRLTPEGLEWTFGINHVGHFLLTRLLLPKIPDGGRVITVASGAHRSGMIDFDDLQKEKRYFGWRAYADSKLANILFARELARREPRIHSNSLHPGVSGTRIFGEAPRVVQAFVNRFSDTAAEIAKTSIKLASSADVEGMTGLFWRDEEPATPREQALDDDVASRLWDATEKLVEA